MPKTFKFTKEQLLQAIQGSYGIASNVAKRLRCDRQTATNNINRFEETKLAFKQEKEMLLDLGENTIVELLKKHDGATTRWLMATLGKERGYTELVEIKKDVPDNQLIFRFEDVSKE